MKTIRATWIGEHKNGGYVNTVEEWKSVMADRRIEERWKWPKERRNVKGSCNDYGSQKMINSGSREKCMGKALVTSLDTHGCREPCNKCV